MNLARQFTAWKCLSVPVGCPRPKDAVGSTKSYRPTGTGRFFTHHRQ
jgi:hypothetical protein